MESIKTYLNWKIVASLFILVLLGFGIYFYKWEYRDQVLEIYFFSLSRGRSVFIRTPKNKTILMGGGQNTDTIREITKVIPFYSRKIDFVIIPSATPNQIGGLIEIINRYETKEIFIPKVLATSTALSLLLETISQKKIHINRVDIGDIFSLEDGLMVNILFPYENFKFNKTSLPELGLSISYGSTTAYFIGNLSKTIQKYIFRNNTFNIGGDNIIEIYNSALSSKVYDRLFEVIHPSFIFNTKEKTTHLISDGVSWKRK